MERAVILARVSSKAQDDEGYSLDAQQKLLQNYCDTRHLNVIRIFRIAETASKTQSRRTFRELLQFISSNDIYHLAVEKTDRLTRNLKDAVAIDEWLEADKDRRLYAVKENLTLHKDAKSDVKFMWNIHIAVAKKYTDNLREEAMKGWAEKLAQGWLPAPPPPGYKTVIMDGKRIHVPDERTSGVIKRVFSLYLDPNHNVKTITAELKRAGVTTRRGRPLAASYVHRTLANPFYVGVNRFDGHDYKGAQEPLISQEVFDKVQKKLHGNRPALTTKHNPVFKNMMICSGCGRTITWQKQKGRYYGNCQRTLEACKGRKYLREDKTEQLVLDMLANLQCPSERIMQWVVTSLRAIHATNTEDRDKQIELVRSKIDRLERMDNDLYDDKLAGDIPRDKYLEKHNQFQSEIVQCKEQLAKLDETRELRFEHGLKILELSQRAAEVYSKKTPEEKRSIIIELFNSLTADGDSVSVEYTKLANAIAKCATESRRILEHAEMVNRTFKNNTSSRGETHKIPVKNELKTIWQEFMLQYRTFLEA
ncbi:MAG TPA: recombinase family protein [Candidatus Saccharimonadales bacterium]|nr:recombinase family protein [Candidatus Saccharimonadales bacterium]